MTKDYNPCPGLFRTPQRGDHEHGPDRRVPRGQVPHPPRAGRTSSRCAAISWPPPPTDRGEFARRDRPDLGPRRAGRKVLLDRRPVHPPRHHARGPRRRCRPRSTRPGGSVTAGNSSPLNVGAAALLIMSEEKASELGLKPLAKVRAMAVAGVDPSEMGIGPVPAVHKALARRGAEARRHRLHRAQRGVRRPGALGPEAAGHRRGEGEHPRRRDRHRPPAGGQRRPDRHHAAAPDARRGRPVRPGHHVRRPGPGGGDDLRVVRESDDGHPDHCTPSGRAP